MTLYGVSIIAFKMYLFLSFSLSNDLPLPEMYVHCTNAYTVYILDIGFGSQSTY